MARLSSVVILQTLFEISGDSDVASAVIREAFNKVNVRQVRPSFGRASEGVLLRAKRSSVLRSAFARTRTEGVRFELTRACTLPVFKTGALNRSATPPKDSDW